MLYAFELIRDHFNVEGDLEFLCSRLKVDYEDLPGNRLTLRAQNLCKRLAANGRLLDLFLEIKRQRPNLHEDIPLCLHEFIAEQCNTEQKINNLLAALNVDTAVLPSHNPVGDKAWRADKAEQLQAHMAESGQWNWLLQVLAAQTDEHVTLDKLQRVFALETPAPAAPPPAPAPEPLPAERPFPFTPFLQLDFVSQHAAFRQHADQPMAAFAVLGLPDTYLKPSLHLLLKRLLAWTTPETAVSRLAPAVDFLPHDPDAIWKQVASKVGLGSAGFSFPLSDDDKRQIAQGVFNRLRTQHVIFIFEGIDDALVDLLVRHFWQKLVAEIETLQQNNGGDVGTKLLAFLVDNQGQLTENTFAHIHAPAPVVLPPVPRFTRDDLLNWLFSIPMANCEPRFREFAHQPQIEELVLEKSSGIPDRVLEFVCAQCGYDYYGEFISWLQS